MCRHDMKAKKTRSKRHPISIIIPAQQSVLFYSGTTINNTAFISFVCIAADDGSLAHNWAFRLVYILAAVEQVCRRFSFLDSAIK